ncbi:hypothetical protein [Burkholderia sp. L27(2015)]|uniref:hypothetical protein n=1 Tax=Burkholderia sp. L27(2015) TaxID=1641858 RepID=UPI00131E4F55|nr:hypothetical protein [Burkholderia sp. L27(2015)]
MQNKADNLKEATVPSQARVIVRATDESSQFSHVETWEVSSVIDDNPLVRSYPIRPTSIEADHGLRVDGVVATNQARNLSKTEKISALKLVDTSFYPTRLESALHADIHDAVLTTWSKVNPLSAAAVARYHQFGKAIEAGKLSLMPRACEAGRGLTLCSVTGSSGNRLALRSSHLLGNKLEWLPVEADRKIPFWPAMVVQWPLCGTLEQFHANFLAAFDAHVDGQYFLTNFRQNAKAQRRSVYVVGLAALANVGVLFVTGACAANFDYKKSIKLLSFLNEFMASSGISVVFVCTAPVCDQLLYTGGIGAALMSGGIEELNWLEIKSEFWSDISLRYYNQSLMWKPVTRVAEDVAQAAAACSRGSRDILGIFYRQLHVAAVRRDAREPSEELLSDVKETVKRQSRQMQFAADEIASGILKKGKVNSANLWGDFMPLDSYRAARALDE